MSVTLNSICKTHATELINAGKVNKDASWSFTAADGDKLLGSKGDDWTTYSQFHLGLHTDQPEKTKGRYGYPIGKGGQIYRAGVIAAKQRAAQQKDSAIEGAATTLLSLIDGKSDGKSASSGAMDVFDKLAELFRSKYGDEAAAAFRLTGRPPLEAVRSERGYCEVRFDRASANAETRTADLTFSSEEPVSRWWGDEVLSHDAGAVNLDRFKSGRANLLVNHDPNSYVGVIESASVDTKQKVGRATVRFGNSPRADEVFRDVRDGILGSVSVGYTKDDMVLSRSGEDVADQYTVTRWTPLEISLVTVPADMSVGVGRMLGAEFTRQDIRAITEAARSAAASAVSQPAAKPQSKEPHIMLSAEETAAAAARAAEEAARRNISAKAAEEERREAVINLCKVNKIDPRVEARWIEDGTPLTQIAKDLIDVLEARGKKKPLDPTLLGMEAADAQRWSLFNAIRVLKNPGSPQIRERAAFELECSRELTKKLGRPEGTSILVPAEILQRKLPAEAVYRALDITPGSKGGYMVGVDKMDFIGILRNRSVAMRMGARVLSGLQGNVVFPRQTGKPSVTWQGGGGTSVTAADQTLGELSMTPHTAIIITDVSIQLLAQASPSAEAFVMADLAADVAIDGVDAATINGTGGAQPLGIKNTTGVTTGQDASSATYAKILAFPQTAGSANAILGNPGFVTNTAGAARLMQVQRFTSTDTPLWVGNMLDGACVGFNAMSSEQLASGNIVFGSWDTLVIGEWGVLELDTDTGGTRFNQAQVGIRAMWMVDVMLRYPQAWVVGTNLS